MIITVNKTFVWKFPQRKLTKRVLPLSLPKSAALLQSQLVLKGVSIGFTNKIGEIGKVQQPCLENKVVGECIVKRKNVDNIP